MKRVTAAASSASLVSLLSLASLVGLALWAAGAAPTGVESREEARLAHAVTRCTRFAELIACDEALNLKPNNPDLLVAEADALVQLKRAGEAIGVYRNALTVGANRDAVNAKILAAQSLRRSLLENCVTREGPFAARSCEAAWLPGALDEITVFKRRGLLLQGDNQPSAALDAYLAAARLAPKDRGVARAIVALSDATGRKDAVTLTAVGTALMTLGHPADAIGPLREAVRLAPDLAPAKERLRTAQRAAAAAAQAGRATQAADVAPASPDAAQTASNADRAAAGGEYSNEAEATRSN